MITGVFSFWGILKIAEVSDTFFRYLLWVALDNGSEVTHFPRLPHRSGVRANHFIATYPAQLPNTIEYFVTFTILAIFANELKQNELWQNQ